MAAMLADAVAAREFVLCLGRPSNAEAPVALQRDPYSNAIPSHILQRISENACGS
jgi:hypothetical protein